MASNIMKRILLLTLAAALLAGLFAGCAKTPAEEHDQQVSLQVATTGKKVEAKEDYVVIAESDSFRLYYYEPTLSIKLEHKATGAILESTLSEEKDDGKNNKNWNGYMKSGIVMTAIIGTTNTYQVDMITCDNAVTSWEIENGVFAELEFPKFGFKLGVEIRLDGDDLVVRVPEYTVSESKEGTYISTVSLFPFLGYTYLGEENGYMLVPDGNGALIYLDDKEGRYATGFSRLIYGNDSGLTSKTTTAYMWGEYEMVNEPNDVTAPVFGMAHTDDDLAYLGIVESGDERCSIECQPNGVMVDYNRCFARFLLRDVFVQPLNNSNSGTVKAVETDRIHTDLQVRYCLLSGDQASYAGMANTYREYLLDKGILEARDCGYQTRIDFMGSEREEFLMGTTAVTMTTVSDIEAIYAELRAAGVQSVLTVYKGWQKGGLYDLPITAYKADRSIGGTAALTGLIQDAAQYGYDVYLYNDGLLVNHTTNATTYNVMKMVNKRTFKLEVSGKVYDLFYYLMPSKAHQGLSRFARDYTDAGVHNLALAGITDKLFTYSSKGSFYSRSDTMASFTDTVAELDGSLELVLEAPNAYLWKYTGAYLDMPLGSSDFLYVDQEVPFLSMVLKGVLPMYSQYVNFEANKTENFLQMVESGIYPSFYVTQEDSSKLIYTNSCDLYSLKYSSYADTIVEYDAQLRALAEKVEGAHIHDHEVLDNGLVKVSYDNGVAVYVNYTEKDLTADGITVAALSYKVGESA